MVCVFVDCINLTFTSLNTTLCLRYDNKTIAAVAVYAACRLTNERLIDSHQRNWLQVLGYREEVMDGGCEGVLRIDYLQTQSADEGGCVVWGGEICEKVCREASDANKQVFEVKVATSIF